MYYNYELELSKEKAQAALLSMRRTAQYYSDSAIQKGEQAQQETDDKKKASIFEAMQKNINTALRLEEEFNNINNYIKELEELLLHSSDMEAKRYNEGFKHGQDSILNFNKSEEAARARIWINERIGQSTEGQWINGQLKSKLGIYQVIKKIS